MAPPSFDLGLRPRSNPLGESVATAPPIEPRQWQRQLIELLRRRLRQGLAVEQGLAVGRDVLVHAGPGAGKTIGALLGFRRLWQEGHIDRVLICCHRTTIARQWLETGRRLGLILEPWQGGGPQDTSHGLVLSYQAATRAQGDPLALLAGAGQGVRWLAIADEVHHLGLDPDEPESSAWGPAFSRLTEPAALRLGLSGTPFRADNLAFCAARRQPIPAEAGGGEQIVPDLSIEPRQLIEAGDVRPLEFRFQDGWVDHGRLQDSDERERSPLSAESRESWRARNLRRAIRLGDGGGIALRVLLQARSRLAWVRQREPDAGGLVVARDIGHARQIAALLIEQGDRVQLVHSQELEAEALLKAFRAGAGEWLVSVDMCSEGFDAPRLRVVAYLTTVVTRSRFVQAITRAVRVGEASQASAAGQRPPSYVFAPADPLLMGYARGWSLSEPYRINPPRIVASGDPGGWGGVGNPLAGWQALDARASGIIQVRGPQLPKLSKSSPMPRSHE
jgi:superfamily II DNA or RNA helicase